MKEFEEMGDRNYVCQHKETYLDRYAKDYDGKTTYFYNEYCIECGELINVLSKEEYETRMMEQEISKSLEILSRYGYSCYKKQS